MRYRKLGRWGVKVSEISLGSWLTYGQQTDEETALESIHRAYELGVNLFDTANEYQGGRAEEVLGKALAGLPRESYLVATKVYMPVGEGPNDRGLSRKHITGQVQASLRRLGVDYLDVYQCHRHDPHTPVEETCRAMDDLVRAGTVLYWGVSEWAADQIDHVVSLCRARGWADPVCNQAQYSAVWRGIEARVLPTCEQLGLGVLAWSPLAMGVLTGKYRDGGHVPAGSRAAGDEAHFMRKYMTAEVLEGVARARALSEEAGYSLTQLALAWCLRRRGVSSAIVGASRVEHVEENVRAADVPLDLEVLRRMDELLPSLAVTRPGDAAR